MGRPRRVPPLSFCLGSRRYANLQELGEKRKDMLEKSCKKFMLFREATELQQWIHEKEGTLTNEEVGSDLEQVEVLQKKFDDFQKVRGADIGGRPEQVAALTPRAWVACAGPEGQRVSSEGHQQGDGGAGV